MLDDNDIKKLKDVFGTKGEIKEMFGNQTVELLNAIDEKIGEVKTEMKEIGDNVGIILKSLDVDVDKKSTEEQEEAMLENKVNRHENWINQIAEEVDVKLKTDF